MKKIEEEKEVEEEFLYRGSHRAPSKETGAPVWDVTINGTYPADFYDSLSQTVRFYGFGEPGAAEVIKLIFSLKGRPNASIKIYRAVPHFLSAKEQIDLLMKQKRYMLKTGKIPKDAVQQFESTSAYYDFISNKIEELNNKIFDKVAPKEISISKINTQDWVTIYKPYAVAHGHHVFGNKFKISSKTVRADEVYISGDSIFEFSYIPHNL